MDEPRERPDAKEQKARHDVELESQGDVEHEFGLRTEREDRAEPRADGFAIVVSLMPAEDLRADRGNRPQDDGNRQKDVGDDVVAGRGQPYGLHDEASIDQPHQSNDRHEGGDGTEHGGAKMVHVLRDAEGLGP